MSWTEMERKSFLALLKSVLSHKATLFISGAVVAGLAMSFGTGKSRLTDAHEHATAASHAALAHAKGHAETPSEVPAEVSDEKAVEEQVVEEEEVVGESSEIATAESVESHSESHHPSPVRSGSRFSQLVQEYSELFHGIQSKVEELMRLETDNHRLAIENAALRKWGESMRFSCQAENSLKSTRNLATRLAAETWAEMGRSLASIRYEMPANLLPKQLYALGLNFFRGREDEKAAKIFSFLTGMEEENTYKTGKDYLITGIAWYRLDHLKEAERYFDLAIKTEARADQVKYQAQARLWKAIVAQRRGDRRNSQSLLSEFMDHHPRAPEAEWVNEGGARRKIASEHDVEVLETESAPEGAGKPVEKKEHGGPSHHHH